jgi:CDP-diacylglycerol--serine O-phosphatidyltransferase
MKRAKVFAVLPTMLTLGNAACGFGAITFAAKVGPENAGGSELLIAAILVFLAMLFDMLDGSAARWTNQTSDFGAQLDSLCDAISFGVAPAFLMLQYNYLTSNVSLPFQYHPRLLWVIAVLFVVCALLRLARFNVETEEDDSHNTFSGLPSPAAAGVIASFPIALRGLRELAGDNQAIAQDLAIRLIPAIKIALPIITLAAACLMVSRIRYSHVFNQLFSGRRSRQHVIQLVFTGAVIFVVREMAVPLIFCYFAFASPLRAAWERLQVVIKRRDNSRPV